MDYTIHCVEKRYGKAKREIIALRGLPIHHKKPEYRRKSPFQARALKWSRAPQAAAAFVFIPDAFPKAQPVLTMSDTAQNPLPVEEAEAAMAVHAADELSRLQNELAELKAKSAELADQYLRAQAEVQNARRRAEDEVAKARKFSIESFAESLLPVADSLDAALAIKEATAQQLREGSDATLRQLMSAFERNKLVAIAPAAGDKFDPHQHQAISAIPSDQAPNTVVSLLQKGYAITDRVLRPALVTVSAPK